MENDDRSRKSLTHFSCNAFLEMIEKARQCYQSAEDIAKKDVDGVDPVRVGLALNFSVFYYDFGNDKDKAIQTAKDVSLNFYKKDRSIDRY